MSLLSCSRSTGAQQRSAITRAARGLAHLVLHHSGAATERGAEHVGVDANTLVVEDVVQPTLDVRHAAVCRPARARFTQNRHLVGDLVADQREGPVEEICDVDLGRALSRSHRPPIFVDGLDNLQVLAQVRA